jgi:hypothetical protein
MAGNPLIAQGTLNRLRGSVVIPAFPALNVTAPFLGKEGIRVTIEGETTVYVPTMTGAVTSPEPYQMANIVMALLKTQGLAAAYKAQMELIATIGDITVTPDTSVLPIYNFTNCAIQSLRELNFAGDDAGFVITLRGYYNINSQLWSLI